MFKRKAIVDERIVNAQNSIYRELYRVIMIICAVSMVVKVWFGHGQFEAIATELIILVVGMIYYVVRSANMGLYSEELELKNQHSKMDYNKKYTLMSLIGVVGVGVVLGVMFGVNSAFNYADSTGQAIKYFVLVFFTTFIMYSPVMFFVIYVPHMAAKRRSERVNERMLEAEDDDEL